jgi:hypothetical protein
MLNRPSLEKANALYPRDRELNLRVAVGRRVGGLVSDIPPADGLDDEPTRGGNQGERASAMSAAGHFVSGSYSRALRSVSGGYVTIRIHRLPPQPTGYG